MKSYTNNKIGVYNDLQDITINIADSLMGSGKTSAMINYINNSDDDEKFIYVTPYLTEVKRIIENCSKKNFKQPESLYNKKQARKNKTEGLRQLLERQENIVTTHSLFHKFTDDIITLCYNYNYTLVMDEVTDVIDFYNNTITERIQPLTKNDVDELLEKYLEIVDGNILKWKEDQNPYNGRYSDVKEKAEKECLALYGNNIMLWLFPIKIFKAFRKIYILTYLFNGQMQKYYYDYFGLKYHNIYVTGNSLEEYTFTEEKKEAYYDFSNLIHILDEEKLNRIGDDKTALSKGWYVTNEDSPIINVLQKNVCNYYKNKLTIFDETFNKYRKPQASDVIWTTFKDYKKAIKCKNFSGSFVTSNMRATNEYSDCSVVIYLINKFMNPFIKKFFEQNNIEVNEDMYALSEMLQFIWRSGIWNGKEISIYIPSRRMRDLLVDWIKENKEKYERCNND